MPAAAAAASVRSASPPTPPETGGTCCAAQPSLISGSLLRMGCRLHLASATSFATRGSTAPLLGGGQLRAAADRRRVIHPGCPPDAERMTDGLDDLLPMGIDETVAIAVDWTTPRVRSGCAIRPTAAINCTCSSPICVFVAAARAAATGAGHRLPPAPEFCASCADNHRAADTAYERDIRAAAPSCCSGDVVRVDIVAMPVAALTPTTLAERDAARSWKPAGGGGTDGLLELVDSIAQLACAIVPQFCATPTRAAQATAARVTTNSLLGRRPPPRAERPRQLSPLVATLAAPMRRLSISRNTCGATGGDAASTAHGFIATAKRGAAARPG